MRTDSKKHENLTDANNVSVAGLSLTKVKDAAINEGKAIEI